MLVFFYFSTSFLRFSPLCRAVFAQYKASVLPVQSLCTPSTDALYWEYRRFVPAQDCSFFSAKPNKKSTIYFAVWNKMPTFAGR